MSHISVCGACIDEAHQKILLIKRRDIPIWVLPGGGAEPLESSEEAVIREIKEETGVDVAIVRQVAVYTPPNRLAFVTHFFECRPVSGVPIAGDEALDAQFFPLNELPTPFFPVHGKWLRDLGLQEKTIIKKPVEAIGWYHIIKYILMHPHLSLRYFLAKAGRPYNSRKN